MRSGLLSFENDAAVLVKSGMLCDDSDELRCAVR
jgi:hypothetical protein